MKMNNERNKERFDSAMSKRGTNTKVLEDLAKPEWREQCEAIVEEIYDVSSTKEFESATKKLQEVFNSVFELITAPGVDEFIIWADDITDRKNTPNTKKLRKYLVDNFTVYDAIIEKINSSKDCIEINNTLLFADIVKNFKKGIKKMVNDFLSKPDEFESGISDFFKSLSAEFEGFNDIEEISYTDKYQLLTTDQKSSSSIAFYDSLFDNIIKANQELKFQGNESNNYGKYLYEIISARIESVENCFNIILSSGVADEPDERLKVIFAKLEDSMLDTKQELYAQIESFLDKKWKDIKENFYAIKKFEEVPSLVFDADAWKAFEKEMAINSIIEEYNNLKATNTLNEIDRTNKDNIESKLKSRAKKISELYNLVSECKTQLIEVFQKIVDTYSNNDKKEMLTKIIESNETLRSRFDEIYGEEEGALTTITNGIEVISEEGCDLLDVLSDGTIATMIEDSNKIKDKFLETIKASGLKDDIDWLESLGDSLILTSLNQHIAPLLEKGLIKITIKTEF